MKNNSYICSRCIHNDNFIERSTASGHLNNPPVNTSHLTHFELSPNDISDVIFNDPATIVLWKDGTKTVIKCQEGDEYSKETGLALCICKKVLGNKGNFNNVFRRWIPEEDYETVDDSFDEWLKWENE